MSESLRIIIPALSFFLHCSLQVIYPDLNRVDSHAMAYHSSINEYTFFLWKRPTSPSDFYMGAQRPRLTARAHLPLA